MRSLMLGIWNDFSNWVTLKWTTTTFALVVGAFAILGLWAIMTFFKSSYNKDKKPKWGTLFVAVLMYGLLAVICLARYVK